MKKILSIILSICMLLSITASLSFTAQATDYQGVRTKAYNLVTGDIFQMGNYPQSEVKDETLLNALNNINCTMTSYGYIKNSKASTHTYDEVGMSYADISYNGNLYRKVTISGYRPYLTSRSTSGSNTGNTYQDDNGYAAGGRSYYFKWEPIVWQVLDCEDDGVYVMSVNTLDSQAYNNYFEDVTWETCSLRSWLNNDFYNSAFSANEKKKILTRTIANENNPYYGTAGGNDTTDKLWMLSYSDSIYAKYGFSTSSSSSNTRTAQGTDYAKSQGLWVNSSGSYSGNYYWWLRTPGHSSYDACNVTYDGLVSNLGSVNYTAEGVRPAFKLNLNSEIFKSDAPQGSNVSSSSIQAGTQSFTVYNKDAIASGNIAHLDDLDGSANLKLNGVKAEYSGNTKTFDKETGISNFALSGNKLTFSKSEYNDYIIPSEVTSDSKYIKQTDHKIYMQKSESGNKPYISTVYVQQLTKDGKAKTAYKEVQHDSLTIVDGAKYNVVISANTKGASNVTYYLSQEKEHRIYDVNGSNVFYAEDFHNLDFNKPIYAYAICDNTVTAPVALKLEKKEYKGALKTLMSEGTINIFGADTTNFTLPDSVPVLGGSSVSTDFVKCPVGVEVEGNRVRVSLGFDIFSQQDKYENGVFKETEWKNYKDSCKGLHDATKDSEKAWKEFQKFLNKKGYKRGKDSSKTWSADFFGYLEGNIVDGGLIITDISGTVAAEFAYKLKAQFGPFGIPAFYAYVKAGAEASAQVRFARAMPDPQVPLKFDTIIGLEPKVTGGAGIGLEGVVSGGAYAKATMPATYSIINRNLKLGLKGEIGVEGHFVVVSGQVPVFTGELNLLDYTFGASKRGSKRSLASNGQVLSYVESEGTLGVVERDYINSQKWVANANSGLRKARSINVSSLITETLEESVNENPQPQLAAFGDKLMMVWVDDDSSRDTYNRYKLVYSVYDGVSWSAPKAVDDCGTNDFAPSIISVNDDVYVAYQNFKKTYTEVDSSTVSELLQNSEIKLAKYNAASDEFGDIKTLSSNSTYDYSPFLTTENGEVKVYWANCASTDYAAGSCSIMKSDFDGNVSTVLSGKDYIYELAAIGNDVYYTMQDDVADENDFDLNLFKNNVRITDNDGSDSMLVPVSLEVAELNGNKTLFYTDNTNVYYLSEATPTAILENGVNISGNLEVENVDGEPTAVWSEATDYGTEFFTSSFSGEEWSQPVQLSEYGGMVSALSLAEYNSTLFGAFCKTERTEEDGAYINGRNDLCILKTAGYTDLAISLGSIDENALAVGTESAFTVFAENRGTKDIESISFEITDSNGYSETISKNIEIKSGEDALIELGYTPTALSAVTLNVTAYADGDFKSDNNSFTYILGNADISISPITHEQIEENNIMSAIVTNSGNVTANDVCVKITNAENELQNVEIGNMAPGESSCVTFEISSEDLEADEETSAITVKFEASTSSDEIALGDNASGVSFEAPAEEHEHDWVEAERFDPSCESEGYINYSCSICGESKTETIPESHEIVIDEAVSASCTESGLTEGQHCSLCGKVLVAQEVTPLLEHNFSETVLQPATCTTDEITRKVCTLCGYLINETVLAPGHNYSSVTVYSTCTQSGYTEYTCSVCGHTYRSNFTSLAPHTFTETVYPATPNARGYTKYSCTDCDYEYTGDYTDYASDPDALIAAINEAHYYSKSKFTAEEIQSIIDEAESHRELSETNAPQSEYDYAVGEILTAIQSVDMLSTYTPVSIEGDIVTLENETGDEKEVSFEEAINEYEAPLDVVKDGIVNAKDYAYLLKNCANESAQ